MSMIRAKSIVVLLLLWIRNNSGAQDWSPEQREVLTAIQDLWRLSRDLEFDPWFERVSDDYRGWDLTASTPRGKAEWLEEAHGRLERPRRVHHQLLPKAIDIHGDVGIIYYTYSALFRSDEGTYNLSQGQWTDVFRKVDDRWLLIADAGGETKSHPDILVSSEWLDRRRGEPNLVVLQVESREDRFTTGHIPGALYLPYDRIAWDGEHGEGSELLPIQEIASFLEYLGISDGDQIVVYSSHPLLATRLWFTLDLMGVGRGVSLLDGGLAAWMDDGRPLSTKVGPAPQPTTLTLEPKLDLIVDADWVLDNGEAEGVAILDARYPNEYTGEGQEGERIGHIPGAGNAAWNEMIESPELFRLKPIDELAAILSAGGVDPGETVVPYCVVGLRASFNYYVARLLGYNALLYDGSFRDWVRRELPLVEGGG